MVSWTNVWIKLLLLILLLFWNQLKWSEYHPETWLPSQQYQRSPAELQFVYWYTWNQKPSTEDHSEARWWEYYGIELICSFKSKELVWMESWWGDLLPVQLQVFQQNNDPNVDLDQCSRVQILEGRCSAPTHLIHIKSTLTDPDGAEEHLICAGQWPSMTERLIWINPTW